MPVLPGQDLTHYRLVEKIGAGGMGEVWRAVDTRLGREVAVKLLPDRLASDPEAVARFEREAKAVAALSHPNILALYDVGQVEGNFYVVTELLQGKTLRALLADGALAPKVAVEYAMQIAQGLSAAHARGLVHRDLKPENIFVTHDGHTKILDFGLARFQSESSSRGGGVDELATTMASPTIAGTLLGTPGYMSPEQVRGQVADHRSDIFSLGAVVHEMLTGRRAFSGPSIADTLSAVLHEDPPRVQTQSGADSAFDELIRKCVNKAPAQRFQSARDVIQALQNVFTGLPLAPEGPSIAVLPFVDMSQGKDQDYFCEGMAEEILTSLSEISGLRVAARTSTFQFRGANQDIRRIGQALGVNNVLEGSVRTAGKRLRVTAQLINVASGYQMWSERYDREMEDVFAIQDEIAHSVTQALAMQLGAPEAGSITRKHSDNLEAYHLYLKGRHERYTTRNFKAALRCFEEASERDPRYALARLGIAEASILLANTGLIRPRVAIARADTELGYAKALAGESAEALTVECPIRAYEWDWSRAEDLGRRAIELDPDFIFARTWLSIVLSARGRCQEAFDMARSAAPIDPLSPMGWTMAAWALNTGRRFNEAEAALMPVVDGNPRLTLALWNLGVAFMGQGRHAEALPVFERAYQAEPESTMYLGMIAWAEAATGRKESAREHLADLHELAKHRHVPRYLLAWTLAALGETEAALDEFERSVDEHEQFTAFPLFPGYDPIRREPRFNAVLERMGLGWAVGR